MKDRYHFDEEYKIKEIDTHVAFDEFVLGTKPDAKISARREARKAKAEKNIKQPKQEEQIKAKEKKKKKIRAGRLIFSICLVGAVLVFVIVTGVKLTNLQIEKRNAEKKLEALKNEKDNLDAELKELDTDEYVENAARSELHMIRDGEVMYIVNPDLADENSDSGVKTK